MMRNLLSIFVVISFFQSCFLYKKGISKEEAKIFIKEQINKNDTTSNTEKLISKGKVLRIAKDSVYSRYGFWNIYIGEKPFKKYYLGKYLYLSGTMREKRGGVFSIVIDRTNGEIKSFSHGK